LVYNPGGKISWLLAETEKPNILMPLSLSLIRLSNETASKDPAKVLTKGCKDCESQFRRDVLIDRLVTDSLQNKPWKAELENRRRKQMAGVGGEKEIIKIRLQN
jgi:hypothetical protein